MWNVHVYNHARQCRKISSKVTKESGSSEKYDTEHVLLIDILILLLIICCDVYKLTIKRILCQVTAVHCNHHHWTYRFCHAGPKSHKLKVTMSKGHRSHNLNLGATEVMYISTMCQSPMSYVYFHRVSLPNELCIFPQGVTAQWVYVYSHKVSLPNEFMYISSMCHCPMSWCIYSQGATVPMSLVVYSQLQCYESWYVEMKSIEIRSAIHNISCWG